MPPEKQEEPVDDASLSRQSRGNLISYVNATVLGGDTVIGARSVIGGNVRITHSVPPDKEIFIKKQDFAFGTGSLRKRAAKECVANLPKEA